MSDPLSEDKVDDPAGGDEKPNISGLLRIDQLCDQFELALRGGQHPKLESYLANAPSSENATLFNHLIRVEVEYRRAIGETPKHEEYTRRFPAFSPLIVSALQDRNLVTAQGSVRDTLAKVVRSAGEIPTQIGRF